MSEENKNLETENEHNLNTFDFLINDEDEVMLLLYEQKGEPKNPQISFNEEDKTAVLSRAEDDDISLSDIPAEVFDSIEETDKLMVCELSASKNEEDTQIIYAYEAEIQY